MGESLCFLFPSFCSLSPQLNTEYEVYSIGRAGRLGKQKRGGGAGRSCETRRQAERSCETRGPAEPLSFFFYSYSCFVGNWAVVFNILAIFSPFFSSSRGAFALHDYRVCIGGIRLGRCN